MSHRATRRLATPLVAAAAVLVPASQALADSATISFLDTAGTNDPAVNLPRTLTVTGNSSAAAQVYVKYRAVGGAPCAQTADADSGTYAYYDDRGVNGNFTLRKVTTWTATGTFQFCTWIAPSTRAIATPITQVVTFRQTVTTVNAVQAPVPARPGQDFSVTVTGAAEAPSRLYVKTTGVGTPCGATAASDTGYWRVEGDDVNGAFTKTLTVNMKDPGDYGLCVWVGQSSYDAAPTALQRFTLSVQAPPPPPAPAATSVGASFPRAVRRRVAVTVSARVASTAGIPTGACQVRRFVARRWETIATAGVDAQGVCRPVIRLGRRGVENLRVRFVPAGNYAGSQSAQSNVRVR